MRRSWLGTFIFRRYVAAIARRVSANGERESRTEGRLRRLREWLIRRGDSVVSMPLGRRTLEMPLSHDLPVHRAMFASYDRLLPDLARVLHGMGARIEMIDVGANVGDTMALVFEFAPNARFVCIEGHPRYAVLLRRNAARLGARVHVIDAYCDDGAGAAWRMTGDAHGSARLASAAAGTSAVPTATLDQLLAADAVDREATLLKIDTDGADLRVLRGATLLLRERQPIVYLEFHPGLLRHGGDDPMTLFPLLAAAGYSRVRLFTNRGETVGTFALTAALPSDAESWIDGQVVEYLDILVWAPAHEAVIEGLDALEASRSHSRRT